MARFPQLDHTEADLRWAGSLVQRWFIYLARRYPALGITTVMPKTRRSSRGMVMTASLSIRGG